MFNETFTYNPGDYVGAASNQIQLRLRFASDGAWSDADGLWETNGAVQVDDITVTVGGTVVDFEDFEDQVADNWIPDLLPGVGDYAQLYVNLQDEDQCRSNFTPQVAFIDDGVVVPGTGGSSGQTWRYGPGGYIVNNTGGPAGPDFYINNLIKSPVLEWPAGAEACYIEYETFRHEELGAFAVWPGMFYQWHVRSVNTGNPADVEDAEWANRNFVQYGGPDYLRTREVVTDLLEPGRTHVQVALRSSSTATSGAGSVPTVRLRLTSTTCRCGPTRTPVLVSPVVPSTGSRTTSRRSATSTYVNLGNNNVRLDCAQNVAEPGRSGQLSRRLHLVRHHGRAGWLGARGIPRALRPHAGQPAVRRLPHPAPPNFTSTPNFFEDGWTLIEGCVYGDHLQQQPGPRPGSKTVWTVDLPDENFFFPGDVLKWYVEAQDNLVGGDIGTSLIPADTSGFSSFVYNLDYPVDYIVRAPCRPCSRLPRATSPRSCSGTTSIGRGGDNEWFFALNQIGYQMGVDYDMYATNGPSSGVGNGLGGRAASAQLAGYNTLLYTSGDLSVNLLANGDFANDPSDDINVVSNWFAQGDKNACSPVTSS